MRKRRTLVVLGTVASNPYAGMAWMHMQLAVGLARLGHDVAYLETTSSWPYDPVAAQKVPASDYAVSYLDRVAGSFGMGAHWGYRRSYADGAWLGPLASRADALLRHADAVFNVAGATSLREDGLTADNLVYYGTDPVYHEVTYAAGVAESRALIDEHAVTVTFGENIGTARSPIPALPRLRARTRQPVLVDLWEGTAPARRAYTTVANWKQDGREVDFGGERYLWSKDVEFLKVADVPARAGVEVELATNMAPPESMRYGEGEPVKTRGIGARERLRLEGHGWSFTDARSMSEDPWRYRDYVRASRAEFGVARDLNVRSCSGWFSERTACYLAAGRPVVTQDTGFGAVLPTGEGLFAFTTPDEAVAAIREIEADYERHARAARAIAQEHFRAETVLARLLDDLGL